jgi:hypothetical protein
MRYICYLSKERVDELFEIAFDHVVDSVDVTRGSEANLGGEIGLSAVLAWLKAGLKFGHKESSASVSKTRITAVSRLTDVVEHIKRSCVVADLNSNLRAGTLPKADWYTFSADLTVRAWEAGAAAIELKGNVEQWELRLACRARDFSGLYEEAGRLIPTSTNYYLFKGEISLPMSGVVRLAAKSDADKVLRGAPLFLVLNPLETDLGALSNVAL